MVISYYTPPYWDGFCLLFPFGIPDHPHTHLQFIHIHAFATRHPLLAAARLPATTYLLPLLFSVLCRTVRCGSHTCPPYHSLPFASTHYTAACIYTPPAVLRVGPAYAFGFPTQHNLQFTTPASHHHSPPDLAVDSVSPRFTHTTPTTTARLPPGYTPAWLR